MSENLDPAEGFPIPKMDAKNSIEKQISWEEIQGAEGMLTMAKRLEHLAMELGGPAEAVKQASSMATCFRGVAMVKFNLALGLGFHDPGEIEGMSGIEVWEGGNN